MSEKSWNKAWSPGEIAENCESWSLAGDAALLNTLKDFSQKMLTKTEEFSLKLDKMLNDLEETGLKLDVAQNEFHGLRNVQFMESRVYEHDETVDSKNVDKIETKVIAGDEQEKRIFDSVKTGMDILDEFYDKVEISVSDSEDDDNEQNYVLHPKDLYIQRPLPPIIGTDDWYKNWHLEGASSESESEQHSDIYSESDSEELQKETIKGSESSSELNFSSETRPAASSTFNASQKTQGTSSDENESIPEEPISFAEQLAAKLGTIISQEENTLPVNVKPIQKKSAYTNLFSDEPPPLEEPQLPKQGLFSGGQNLFDDVKDEPFWPQKSLPQNEAKVIKNNEIPTNKGLFDSSSSDDEDIFSSAKSTVSKQNFLKSNPRLHVPLFEDEPPTLEEDIPKKKPTGGVSIFGSEKIFEDIVKTRKINDNLKSDRNVRKNLFDEENEAERIENDIKETKTDEQKKKNDKIEGDNKKNLKIVKNLFDTDEESEGSFQDDIKQDISKKNQSLFEDSGEFFQEKEIKKKIGKLFDDDDDYDDSTIFQNESLEKNSSLFKEHEDIVVKTQNLFEESDENENKSQKDIIQDEKENEDYHVDKKENEKDNLEEMPDNSQNETNDVIENEKVIKKLNIFDESDEEATFNEIKEESNRKLNEPKKKITLFDDDDDEEDDFFSNIKPLNTKLFDDNNLFKTNQKLSPVEEILKKSEEKSNEPEEKPNLSHEEPPILEVDNETPQSPQKSHPVIIADIFSSSPPPVENDTWDNKSDSFSESDDILSYHRDENSEGSNLFYNEPPALTFDESSGIVKNVTSESEDFSFTPYQSSTRRLSSDIYNEQQSDDSFFLTKHKSVFSTTTTIPQSLNPIQESTPQSILEITPSGNPEDFNDSSDETPKSKVASITELLRKESDSGNNKEPTSPGKLKHNLKINVSALMPGSAPPKLSKSQSLDQVDDNIVDIESDNVVKSHSFDEALGSVEVLQSITKDRAKIPIKRRPSTRKGRQASIQKLIEEENYNQEEVTPETKKDDIPQITPKQSIFSDEDSDNDLFAANAKIEKTPKKSLFSDTSSGSDEDLFKSRKDTAKKAPSDKVPKKFTTQRKPLNNVKTNDDPLSNLLS